VLEGDLLSSDGELGAIEEPDPGVQPVLLLEPTAVSSFIDELLPTVPDVADLPVTLSQLLLRVELAAPLPLIELGEL
jgi:hypothetical protein